MNNRQPLLPSIGDRFGMLTIVSEPFSIYEHKHKVWWVTCQCDCGTPEYKVRWVNIKNRPCPSCGCQRAIHSKRHGMCNSPEYKAWHEMRQRCYNPNAKSYHNYGGRGISVCPRWRESFPSFLADMGLRPSSKHSIDRIDNNGSYEPNNCRWATLSQQHQNYRQNRLLTVNGKTQCITAWAEELNMDRRVIYNRAKLGWSDEDCLKPYKERKRPNSASTSS